MYLLDQLYRSLDSSAIVCEINSILKDKAKQTQKTFSSCSVDERYDEKKWMDIVVRETKLMQILFFPNGEDVFKLTDKILWHQMNLTNHRVSSWVITFFNRLKKKTFLFYLNGQGADEYIADTLSIIHYERLKCGKRCSGKSFGKKCIRNPK
jgi:asparagine synthase (glutamine-hydrolysing)